MKELSRISREFLKPVMDELNKQLKPVLYERLTREQQEASMVFYGTLCHLLTVIFSYLPAEEREQILVNCGTWFNVGLLEGRAPQKLVEILNAVNPKVETFSVPDWMSGQRPANSPQPSQPERIKEEKQNES